ncbi:MAG: helix-turn-helix transcriptional regulator [Lautropia sp.]
MVTTFHTRPPGEYTDEHLHDLQSAADILRISPSGVRNLVRQRVLPEPIRIGRRVLWQHGTLMAAIAALAEGSR